MLFLGTAPNVYSMLKTNISIKSYEIRYRWGMQEDYLNKNGRQIFFFALHFCHLFY